jgi:phage FluMu protein Com
MKKCTGCGKILSFSNFSKHIRKKDGYATQCKECLKILNSIYSNTEHGYLTHLYQGIKRRESQKRFENYSEEEKAKRRCYITKKEFFELWELHKKKYGYTCALTGVPIVHKTSTLKSMNKSNGISVDRLDPSIGYTKENIIFVSNKANQMKNNVTKDLCVAIIKAHEERGL